MINIGDKVVCVGAEHSTCELHNEEICGPDPHPEMEGKVFLVIDKANWARDLGCTAEGIILGGSPDLWCSGCFRKIERASEEFTDSLKVKEPA